MQNNLQVFFTHESLLARKLLFFHRCTWLYLPDCCWWLSEQDVFSCDCSCCGDGLVSASAVPGVNHNHVKKHDLTKYKPQWKQYVLGRGVKVEWILLRPSPLKYNSAFDILGIGICFKASNNLRKILVTKEGFW